MSNRDVLRVGAADTARLVALSLAVSLTALLTAAPSSANTCDLDQTLPGCPWAKPAKRVRERAVQREPAKPSCLGGTNCRYESLDAALREAKKEWERDHDRIPVIEVYPIPGRKPIATGNARIDFPVTLHYPGQHADARYVPVIAGACIDIVGEGNNYPSVTLKNLELQSCLRVEYAHLTLENLWITPPKGATAVSVTAGVLDARGVSLSGQGGGTAVSLTAGARAQFDGLLASNFDTGIRADRVSFGFCGEKKQNRIWNVKTGVQLVAPPDAPHLGHVSYVDPRAACPGRGTSLGSFTIEGPGAGSDSTGIEIGPEVPADRITIGDVDISGFGRAIDSTAPLWRIYASTFRGNTTAIRFGGGTRHVFEPQTDGAFPVFDGLAFEGNNWDLDTAKFVSVKGARIPKCIASNPDRRQAQRLKDELGKSCAKIDLPPNTDAHMSW